MESKTKAELMELARQNNVDGVTQRMTKGEILEKLVPELSRIKLAKKRELIRQDLLDQLERDNIIGAFYVDLVNDYMAMWDVKNQLIDDIERKGVSVRYQNGENQFGYKKNDSVAELQRTNNQMLRLLEHLGLKGSRLDNAEYDPSNMEM